MKMKMKFVAAAAFALAAAAFSQGAQAASYVAFSDFALANPNGVWSYGSGVGGAQVKSTGLFSSCYGLANLECVGIGSSTQPYVGRLTGGPGFYSGTAVVPNDILLVHPGDGVSQAPDTSLVFTAPTSGSYAISSLFDRLDVTANGNGVDVGVYKNATEIYSGFLAPTSGSTLAASTSFTTFGQTLSLAAGDTLTFDVHSITNYYNDTTGVNVTISAVPEPATWAMLALGLGVVGVALRTGRRRLPVSA